MNCFSQDNFSDRFDVIVVGAGHAGIEASLAAARLGCRTLCLCTNLDSVGNLPCNPSIGGTAKGQLAREIDALGGEIAKAADATCMQFRMLNRGKGPAVFSPRAQNDRMAYRAYMRGVLDSQPGLFLAQGECSHILQYSSGAVAGIRLAGGTEFAAPAVVLATGTFLGAKTFTGDMVRSMGPDGLYSADLLTQSLRNMGLTLRRFKTGTPPRLDADTIDLSKFTPQPGDEDGEGFSFSATKPAKNTALCYLGYTNSRTHEVIRAALHRSPLYGGAIEGVGPRYCPSIEDKIVRFADKERHQIFLEPCGESGRELYAQGFSTSLPEDVQLAMLRTVEGMETVRIIRPGYAIEYDCLDPTALTSTLAVKEISGLFAAGQLCGSSGYEEAAAQGLVAGINAAHFMRGKLEFVLQRSDGYIGTLIDDLVTRGTNEPYRMMTSRCEHRLICRQDNADKRLMPIGHALGLISDEALARMEAEYSASEEEVHRLGKTIAPPSEAVNTLLESLGTTPLSLRGASLKELLRRPEIDYQSLSPIDYDRPRLSLKTIRQVEITIKYEGYIKRQLAEVQEAKRMENRQIPDGIDYMSINSIRTEARQKLAQIRPRTFGQAARISGVSPSDIGALMIWLSAENGSEARPEERNV